MRRRAGLTLIELLAVMAVIGILLGAGVGVLASLDLGERAALGRIQNAIRSTRNTALARRAPARVRLLAPGAPGHRGAGDGWALQPEVLELVGTWHFEGDLEGAFGLTGTADEPAFADDGYIGRALGLAARDDSAVEFPVQNDPAFDFQQGFVLECALRLEAARNPGVVVDAGGLFGLELQAHGALSGWLVPAGLDERGQLRPKGRQELCTDEGALSGPGWHRVRFEYDRRLARISVEGVELARTELDVPLWRMEGPLALGDGRQRVGVGVDALVIGAFIAAPAVVLEDTLRLVEPPPVIAFDAAGHLDRELHGERVELVLELEDGRRAPVHVGAYGTVDAGEPE